MMAMERALDQIVAALGLEGVELNSLVRHVEQLVRERDTFRDALHEALVPLVKRARKLQPHDIMQADNGGTWSVMSVESDAFGVTVDLLSHKTGRIIEGKRIDHPDEPITVLAPTVVRDGLLVLRRELGAQLLDHERPGQDAG